MKFDGIWLDAAARLGIPVVRGGDAYVHWDGQRLHIADDAELDADDTVGQLVLHEICHAIVQNTRAPDWDLDNTTDRDKPRELAAVRLEAHLCGAWGLRSVLFPTTPERAFFFALGPNAIGDDALAREAAARAAGDPWRAVLAEALAKTAAAVAAATHRATGAPLCTDGRTCGDCAWRTKGGTCRVGGKRVAATATACTRWETGLDCQTCAACCRHAYDSVTVTRRDAVVKRHPALVVDRNSYLELRREGDHCAALSGCPGGPFACTIYDDRPRPCRDFELGGRHCLVARRRVGLSF